MQNVLFISGGIGLGHVTRDIRIADELRKKTPAIDISWLAAEPAKQVIIAAGEKVLPESEHYADETHLLEMISRNYTLNLMNPMYLFRFGKPFRELLQLTRGMKNNVAIFKEVTGSRKFDLVIGDETYDLAIALTNNPALKKAPFVMIYDFVGVDSMTHNLLEKISVYMVNRWWAKLCSRVPSPIDLSLFVGEKEDIPDRSFGFLLPHRRESAGKVMKFLGYICPCEASLYADKAMIRTRLGYGSGPLIICAVGGTAIGAPMLELCVQAYDIIKESIPGLRMVLVCGPRVSLRHIGIPPGIETRGFVYNLYEHFAACDLAIVQGGGTTTLELTALRCPFIYFPLEKHFEQQDYIACRLERHKAGIKMQYSQTTPGSLAETVIANIGKNVSYAPMRTDGAQQAAKFIYELLHF